LSHVFGYSTITTGLVMAPRGMGTMVSMILVGRLVRLVDPRYLVITGLLLTALSLYMMTGFSPQMDSAPVIWTGVIQGLGLGLVFVPLSTVAFATLDVRFRTDAASLFSLVRNIGSSIGISVVTLLLSRSVQINHQELGAFINPFNPVLKGLLPGSATDPAMLEVLDGLVNQQSLMISYNNDFKLMMLVTLFAVPLALMLRKPRASAATAAPAAAHLD
ncbi:MAG: MFS transporter, partial [Hoeflea sp.]|uniref:MFS transporter n=1 Tax=Hoeflea sp. TaxID=1940281 RepID=UPI003298DFA3